MSAATTARPLSGKVIWVIGAAGAIGTAMVATFSDRGATVIGSSRRSQGDAAHWIPLDIRSTSSVDEAAARIAREHRRLDGLVVSTTLPIFGDFLTLSDEDWLAVLDTKLLGSVRAVRAATSLMEKQGGGDIVLVTGTARGGIPALKHWPGASANAALNLLVHGLSARFAPLGVRVNALAPGPIESERSRTMQALSTHPSTTHLGRAGTAEEVAEAAAFLLSPASGFITGSILPVDGGGRTGL